MADADILPDLSEMQRPGKYVNTGKGFLLTENFTVCDAAFRKEKIFL